jgi:hypothetical protein
MVMKRLAILLAMTSCISTEVIGYEPEQIDTIAIQRRKPHKPLPPMPPADTTNEDRVPIDWNANVGEWDNIDTN